MTPTHAELEARRRHEMNVELVARRPVDCGGERCHRLLVADRSGAHFSILIAPEADPLYDLQTGASYRICGLDVCEPPDGTGDSPAGSTDDATIEPEDAFDPVLVRAADRLGLEEPFGVVDEHSTVSVGRHGQSEGRES